MDGMTVGELIIMLEEFDEEAPVRLATQPNWPFANTIDGVGRGSDGTVWIGEGEQVRYLPHEAREALGWGADFTNTGI